MVTDDFYYIKDLDFPNDQLVPIPYNGTTYTKAQRDSVQKRLSEFTSAFYETAKYMLMNNKRD